MNQLDELRLHAAALLAAVRQDETFFASVTHYVERLHEVSRSHPSQRELDILAASIEAFFSKWRPSTQGDAFYFPPRQTADADATVLAINGIVGTLVALGPEEFDRQISEATPIAGVVSWSPLATIDRICTRFHAVARQLRSRHDGRPTLDVGDEYDVQDLLHALLRLYFDDVREEEATPSYAAKSTRMDFLLKEERIVVETKMSRPSLRAKELGSQLIEDITRYKTHPDCGLLVCFVYDPAGSIANPRGIENDLRTDDLPLPVRVLIRPE